SAAISDADDEQEEAAAAEAAADEVPATEQGDAA
ncbi:MAG: hypothetical protein JWR59_238, partial [Brevundimonas sp.]|nr:hypothetical protein [Brevundimonas sp.]